MVRYWGVLLYLVEEDEGVLVFVKSLSCQHAEIEVEFFRCLDVLECLFSLIVFHEIDFHEVLEQSLAHLSDDIRLAYLAGSFHDENLVRVSLKVVFYVVPYLPIKHNIYTFQ